MTRHCRLCDYLRVKRGSPVKPEVIVQVRAALERGATINEITGGGRPMRLLAHHALNRLRRENQEVDQLILERIKGSNSRAQKRRRQRARNIVVREQNNDYDRIRAMLPAGFPDKDDVVSDIIEALLNGRLRREDVRSRVRSYVIAHNRMFPTKFAKFGDRPLVSLDAVLFEGGATTRGDTVNRGFWD
jgi:type IV pilus biogenesis protein CpaD/CtpE